MIHLPFANCTAAGRALAEKLVHYRNRDDIVVLGLPRGGVPVAYEVAELLCAPLDVMVVRKLGLPAHKEFAMGAIAHGGIRIINEHVIQQHKISDEHFEQVAQSEIQELKRREQLYRGNRPWPDLRDCCAILVDDGLATGSTMRAAIEAARRDGAKEIVMAIPVASPQKLNELAQWTDEAICVAKPEAFSSVGQWYRDFSQTTDDEVQRLLAQARSHRHQGMPEFVNYSPDKI